MSVCTRTIATIVFLVVCVWITIETEGFPFVDESIRRGLKYGRLPRKKFGGASVVDLDEDGWPDLLLGHHGGIIELYFNSPNGFFKKNSWGLYRDCHGINSLHLTTFQKGKHFIISRGGANGNKPGIPDIYYVDANQKVSDVTNQMNGADFAGRGRTFVSLYLTQNVFTRTDGLFINVPPINGSNISNFAARSIVGSSGPTFSKEIPSGFATVSNDLAFATDVDGDRVMEIVSYPNLKMFQHDNFVFKDISSTVFPSNVQGITRVIAIAELDYDNDGDMDLFIGRSGMGGLVGFGKGFMKKKYPDFLLKNVGGRYIDVTKQSNIPLLSHTRGVTTGDFNNDGWIDIILTRFDEADIILWNNGDGTFKQENAQFNRSDNTPGDQVTAVDLNKDGLLDVVLSEGSWNDRTLGGEYRLMMNHGLHANYLSVRVGNSPSKKCSSLHAIVQVTIGQNTQTKRVSSPGSVVSHSYIENVHFGIGTFGRVSSVIVTWIDGSSEVRTNVLGNTEISFGVNRL